MSVDAVPCTLIRRMSILTHVETAPSSRGPGVLHPARPAAAGRGCGDGPGTRLQGALGPGAAAAAVADRVLRRRRSLRVRPHRRLRRRTVDDLPPPARAP